MFQFNINKNRKQGYTLLEALLAIGLAALFLSTALSYLFISSRGSAEGIMRQHALLASEQGIEVLRTIAFDELVPTNFGSLNFSSGQWLLSSNAPDVLDGGFSRTVRVIETERDAQCDLVESGGTVDPDSYVLESEVSWQDLRGETQTIVMRSLRTNWTSPNGSCFAADCSMLDWDVLSSSWYGGKQLREIYITNNTGEKKTVDKITLSWDYSAEIEQIFFGSDKVWSASGPGTPSGRQLSGTVLDVENADIDDGETIEMHKTQFTQKMEGSTISITYECDDGSSVMFGPFTPTY